MNIQQVSKTLIAGLSLAMFLSSCGSGSSSGSEAQSNAVAKFAPGEFSSAEVGEVPTNGTRPVESLCSAGTFVKSTPHENSCPSEQFDIFLDNGYYAARGFADKEYYFWEALLETFEAPSFVTNNLVLLDVPVGGFDKSLCSFFCSEDGQSISVSCIDHGVSVCGETIYVRVATPAAPTDVAADPSALTPSSGQCENASGSYTLDHVTCNPGTTIPGSQLGEPLVLEVNSADDLNAATAMFSGSTGLPGTTAEAHYECPADGSEVHIIANATSNGFSISCDYTFLR